MGGSRSAPAGAGKLTLVAKRPLGKSSNGPFTPGERAAGEGGPLGDAGVLGRARVEPLEGVSPATVGGLVAAGAMVECAEVREDLTLRLGIPDLAQDRQRRLARHHGGLGVELGLGEREVPERQR